MTLMDLVVYLFLCYVNCYLCVSGEYSHALLLGGIGSHILHLSVCFFFLQHLFLQLHSNCLRGCSTGGGCSDVEGCSDVHIIMGRSSNC